MAKKRKLLVAALLLAMTVGIAVVVYVRVNGGEDNALTLYGNVDIRETALAFQEAQRVERMDAEEGDLVEQGQVLATLDRSRLEPAVEQARARVEAQEAVVARLRAGSRPEEIAEARQTARRLEARLENARRDLKRLVEAYEAGGAATRQEIDEARTTVTEIEAQLQRARESLQLLILGPRQEDIARAEATLRALRARLDELEVRLADTRLQAPVRGTIRERILEVGDLATPQTPAYTIAHNDPVWVRAYVSEPNLGKLFPGMDVRVTTDSYPDKVYHGTVGYISPTAEFTPKQVQTEEVRPTLVYQVRITVANPNNELRLGMPVTVTVPLDQAPPPASAPSSHPTEGPGP
ncbi:MAG: efflux RND transporter periplasmic adaptor subunit [Planctomycetota bacterium]